MSPEARAKQRHIPLHLVFLAVVLSLVFGGFWFSMSLGERGKVPAQDFTLPLIGQDGEFTLSEQRGKVVVINLFGSWCAPCRDEAPILQAAYEDFRGREVVFVGVAIDDTESDALAFVEEFGITYLNVIDLNNDIERIYHIYGVPVTLIVDRDGKVVKTFFARPPETDLRHAINEAL